MQSIRYPFFVSDLNEPRIFLDKVWENTQISDFMETRTMGAELLHAGRQTDRHD